MAGLTITPVQRVALARRLNIDPHELDAGTLLRTAGELSDRAGRSFEESDPSGILKIAPLTTPVTAPATDGHKGDAMIDAAVARGKIQPEDRTAWSKRFQDDAEFTRELLDALPSNKVLADRAYAEDQRLNDLGDALDGYLGVAVEDRVARDFDEDAGLPDSERLYRWLADATNAPDAP